MTDARTLARLRKLVTLAATSPAENEARNAGVEACKILHREKLLDALDGGGAPPRAEPEPPPVDSPAASRRRYRGRSTDPTDFEDLRRREAAGEVRVSGPGARHLRKQPRTSAIHADRFVVSVSEAVGEEAKELAAEVLSSLFGKKR